MTPVDARKRLVIVGATGMVGGYALRYALDHAAVGGVTVVGRKPTGISKRVFKPNLQTIQCQVGGGVKTMRVCVKCIRGGLVQRPIKKKAFTMPTSL